MDYSIHQRAEDRATAFTQTAEDCLDPALPDRHSTALARRSSPVHDSSVRNADEFAGASPSFSPHNANPREVSYTPSASAPAAERLRCNYQGCTKSFLRREHLIRHQLNHDPTEVYYCNECPKQFFRPDLLRRHQQRHRKGMWFRKSGTLREDLPTPPAKTKLRAISPTASTAQPSKRQMGSPDALDNRLAVSSGIRSFTGAPTYSLVDDNPESPGYPGAGRSSIPRTQPAPTPLYPLRREPQLWPSRSEPRSCAQPLTTFHPSLIHPGQSYSTPGWPPGGYAYGASQRQTGEGPNAHHSPLLPPPAIPSSAKPPPPVALPIFGAPLDNVGSTAPPASRAALMSWDDLGWLFSGAEDSARYPGAHFAASPIQGPPLPDKSPTLGASSVAPSVAAHYCGEHSGSSSMSEPPRIGPHDSSGGLHPGFCHVPSHPSVSCATLTGWHRVISELHVIFKDPSLAADSLFTPQSLQHCVELYLKGYHDHFPFLHRAALSPAQGQGTGCGRGRDVPALLLFSVCCLGASLADDNGLYLTALKVHDRLRWALFSDSAFLPCQIWVLQALLLVQAFGKMISSRQHYEVAHVFHSSILTSVWQLMRRGRAYSAAEVRLGDSNASRWHAWIEFESTKRAAFFAFVMDAQHASLFGHTPSLAASEMHLTLPCSEVIWDVVDPDIWITLNATEPPTFLSALKNLLHQQQLPPDLSPFASFTLLHGLCNVSWHLEQRETFTLGISSHPSHSLLETSTSTGRRSNGHSTPPSEGFRSILLRAISTWPVFCLQSGLAAPGHSLCLDASLTLHHIAFVIVSGVKFNDLHMLAGAASLLCRPHAQQDYALADASVRRWASSADAWLAVRHAAMLLKTVLFGRVTGKPIYRARDDTVAPRVWSAYGATLVLWAYGYITEGTDTAPRQADDPAAVEAYLDRIIEGFGSRESAHGTRDVNRTGPLLGLVAAAFCDARWELVREASETFIRILGARPQDQSARVYGP